MAIANVPITRLPEATSPSANDYLILQGKSTQKIKWSVLLDKLYPVGSLYMSAKATSPASLFGGTWEQIKDRFILAAGDTYAAGSTGGEAAHTLTVGEMPAHYHKGLHIDSENGMQVLYGSNPAYPQQALDLGSTYKTGLYEGGIFTSVSGKSEAHNNLPPYLSAYIWQRIA